MKVLFSNPPMFGPLRGCQQTAWVRAGSRWPFSSLTRSMLGRPVRGEYVPAPLFLMYAASYAAKAGADVTFRDSIATRESYKSFYDHVREGQYDYILLESATPSWQHDAGVIAGIHQVSPESKIVVGGTLATTKGEEILRTSPVHAVLKGEMEKGIVKVLNGASGLIDFDFLTQEEMNAAPAPYMDELHSPLYFDSNPKGQIWPHAQVWSSRGCLWRCNFCAWPSTMTNNDPTGEGRRAYRRYTPEYMEAFLSEWRDRYNFRSIYDDSDTMNIGDKHTLDIAQAYKRVGLPWSAMCRADTLKRETWQAMKDCGCFGVKLGMETGSARVMDQIIHKQLNLNTAVQTLRWLKEIGIAVHTTWSIGHPGETDTERQETLDMIQRLYREGLHQTHQLSGTVEIEGTPLATGLQLGGLKKYPGMKADGFDFEKDGTKKAQKILAGK